MSKIVVLGYGPVGQSLTKMLAARGDQVIVAQRRKPDSLPDGATFEVCDALDASSLKLVATGASAVVCAIGLAYEAAVWEASWPKIMANMLAACEASGARLVFVDDLYMYGPQKAPLREDMPLNAKGRKGKVRAAITRQWLAASQAGKVKATALRVPDFYGPDVKLSVLGDAAIGALAQGGSAKLILAADAPHAMAYVPDVARATILLIDAPDDVYGQAWHMPSAPARSPREILTLAAATLGV